MRADTRILDPARIIETIQLLHRRIGERFPEAGLCHVARDLCRVAEENERNVERISRADGRVRLAVGIVIVVGAVGLLLVIASIAREDPSWWRPTSGSEMLAMFDSTMATLVFLGAAVVYLVSLERRRRRERVLRKIHELRSIAHVVDMHQLKKDPDRISGAGPRTSSSPRLDMTPFEVRRYLDYCSEMLALIAKIGALYLHGYEDAVAVQAVDDLEGLTTGLSRKIWQKIMALDDLEG